MPRTSLCNVQIPCNKRDTLPEISSAFKTYNIEIMATKKAEVFWVYKAKITLVSRSDLSTEKHVLALVVLQSCKLCLRINSGKISQMRINLID